MIPAVSMEFDDNEDVDEVSKKDVSINQKFKKMGKVHKKSILEESKNQRIYKEDNESNYEDLIDLRSKKISP